MIDVNTALKTAGEYISLLGVDQLYFHLDLDEVNNRQHSFCIDVFYKDTFVGHIFVDYWCGMINPYLTTDLFTLEEHCYAVSLPD